MQWRIFLRRREDAGEDRKHRSFADFQKITEHAAPDLFREYKAIYPSHAMFRPPAINLR